MIRGDRLRAILHFIKSARTLEELVDIEARVSAEGVEDPNRLISSAIDHWLSENVDAKIKQ